MPLSGPLRVSLFPTSGAIAESLQIGRSTVIEQLTTHALGGETQFLAEDRHLGKSSVVRAMIDRALSHTADNLLVLSVDLRDGVADSQKLAQALLIQAAHQKAGLKVLALAKRGALARLAKPASAGIREAGELFNLQDEAAIVAEVGDALNPGSAAGLGRTLKALDARGHVARARTIIALDEAQDLAAWPDGFEVQRHIAATIKRAGSTIAFVISGSEKHTIAAFFDAPGAPMEGLGMRRRLPEISRDDWISGLMDRYTQAGVEIYANEIHQILYESAALPLPTMLICQHTLDWLEDDRVTAATVAQAVKDAQRHPSWDVTT